VACGFGARIVEERDFNGEAAMATNDSRIPLTPMDVFLHAGCLVFSAIWFVKEAVNARGHTALALFSLFVLPAAVASVVFFTARNRRWGPIVVECGHG
jgi:hypothetical protein